MNSGDLSICPNRLLYRCVAHFMGRKAPGSSIDSIESVQKPLSEIYSVDPRSCLSKDVARDVHLLVFTNGIYAIPTNPIDSKIWIQMQNLRSCAAVKGVGQSYDPANACGLTFKALDSPEAASSPLPAIFTVIAARGNCVPLLDCYIFSCPSNVIAMTLVEKSRQAFGDRRGWSSNNKPPPVTMLDISENFTDEKWHCKTDESSLVCREPINPELYQKPSLHGFYYAPKTDIIRTYDIGIEAEAYPMPEVETHPSCSEPCPQYIIINQQAGAEISPYPAPPPQQSDVAQIVPNGYLVTDVASMNWPGNGDLQAQDPNQMTQSGIWVPQQVSLDLGADASLAPPAYPNIDPSMIVPFAQSGYYPALLVDQPTSNPYEDTGAPMIPNIGQR